MTLTLRRRCRIPRTHVVEWDRSEMEPRRSVWENALDDLVTAEQQYLDCGWSAIHRLDDGYDAPQPRANLWFGERQTGPLLSTMHRAG